MDRALHHKESLHVLGKKHHSECCFSGKPAWLPELSVDFDNNGVLHGMFTAHKQHQGYNGRVHGGILSAIIDASMAMCCMGHGIAGYTADLSIKYRNPVIPEATVQFVTSIVGTRVPVLYTLTCTMLQYGKEVVKGTGRYFRFE